MARANAFLTFSGWRGRTSNPQSSPGEKVQHALGVPPWRILKFRRFQHAASYDGCDLEIRAAPPKDTAPRERGDLIAFRAIHRVTPITLDGGRGIPPTKPNVPDTAEGLDAIGWERDGRRYRIG